MQKNVIATFFLVLMISFNLYSATPVQQNLILNSTFVSNLTNWTVQGNVSVQSIQYTSPEGQTFYKSAQILSVITPSTISQVIHNLNPETLYTFAVKIKISANSGNLSIGLNNGVQRNKTISSFDDTDVGFWKEKRFVFYTDVGSTSAEIFFSMNAVASNLPQMQAEITDVRVLLGELPIPSPEQGEAPFYLPTSFPNLPIAGGNLLVNGQFQTTQSQLLPYETWVFDGNVTVETQNQVNEVVLTAETGLSAHSIQTIPFWLAPNTNYTFTCAAYITGSPLASVYMIESLNAAAPQLFHEEITNPDWQQITVKFTTPAYYLGYSKVILEAYQDHLGTAHFKNVELIATGKEWTDVPGSVPPKELTPFTENFVNGLDPNIWLINNTEDWGGDNAGVSPKNVYFEDGNLILEAHGDLYTGSVTNSKGRKTRLGASICTKNYYASGTYTVVAKLPNVFGLCSTFWIYHWLKYTNGQPQYWQQVNPIRYNEIDWEMPTAGTNSSITQPTISYEFVRNNSWGGVLAGDGFATFTDVGLNLADGNWHTFVINWQSGSTSPWVPGVVQWSVDGKVVRTLNGSAFGEDDIPFMASRFCFGAWFPAEGDGDLVGWAGDPNFDTAQLMIKYLSIVPNLNQNDAWVAESLPDLDHAPPDQYPAKPMPVLNTINVEVQVGTPWESGPGMYQSVVNFYVMNMGNLSVNVPWTIKITNSNYSGASNSWNVTVEDFSNHTITAQATQSWEILQPSNANTVNFGMIISSSIQNFNPSQVTLNGQLCSLTFRS